MSPLLQHRAGKSALMISRTVMLAKLMRRDFYTKAKVTEVETTVAHHPLHLSSLVHIQEHSEHFGAFKVESLFE